MHCGDVESVATLGDCLDHDRIWAAGGHRVGELCVPLVCRGRVGSPGTRGRSDRNSRVIAQGARRAIAIAGVAVVVGPVSSTASEVELATASARVATTDATRTSLWIMTLACGIVVIVAGIVVSMGSGVRSLSKRQSGAKPANTPWGGA